VLNYLCKLIAFLVLLNGVAVPLAIGAEERMPVARASMGNVDGDGDVDLADAILALQAVVDLDVLGIAISADVNQDDAVGLAEAIYAMKSVAARQPPSERYFVTVSARQPKPYQYDDWLGSSPDLLDEEQALDADPDGDGMSNLVEFALGFSPGTPNTPPAPKEENGDWVLSFDIAEPALEVTPQVAGEDLGDGFTNANQVSWASVDDQTTHLTLRAPLDKISKGRIVIRSAVNLDPSFGSGLALAQDAADPMSLVEVTGIPEDAVPEELYAEFRLAGSQEPIGQGNEAPVLPIIIRDGTPYLATPLMSPDGSQIRLKITDGMASLRSTPEESYSQELTLTLNPLPAAEDGAYQNALSAIEGLIQTTTEGLGLQYPQDLDTHLNNPSDTPPYLISLVQAYHRIADPNNPDALMNAPLSADGLELTERILSGRQLDQAIQNLSNFYASDDAMLDEIRNALANGANRNGRAVATFDRPQDERRASQRAAVRLAGPFQINHAEQLSELMKLYKRSRDLQQDLDLATQVFGTYLMGVGLIAPGLGNSSAAVATKAGVEGLRAFINMSGAVSSAVDVARNFAPAYITRFDTALDPPAGMIGFEDAEEPQVTLKAAEADARSETFNPTKFAFEKAVDKLGSAGGEVLKERYSSELADMSIDATKDEIVGQLVDQYQGDPIYFEWTGIDMMGQPRNPTQWLDHAFAAYGNSSTTFLEQVATGQEAYAFRLVAPDAYEVVKSVLRIETDPAHFPVGTYSAIAQDSHTVEFDKISVQIEPPSRQITEPGTYSFDIVINNSILKYEPHLKTPLTIAPEQGRTTNLQYQGNGRFTFDYVTPDPLPDDFDEVRITAQAAADTGVRGRAENPPVRSGSTFLTAKGRVDLSGPEGCLDPGSVFDVTAETTPAGADLTWSVSTGSIQPAADDAGATVTPPDEYTGTITVTATYDGPAGEVSDAVSIKLGSCESYAAVSIGSVTRTYDCQLLPLPEDAPPDRAVCFASYDATPSSHINVTISVPTALTWAGRVGDNGVFPGAFGGGVSENGGECGAHAFLESVPVSVDVQWFENDTVYDATASGTGLLTECIGCGEETECHEFTGNFSIHIRSIFP